MFSSIYFEKYKSFSTEGFNSLYDLERVNVFIGKNNSGKSSILDIVNCVYDAMYHAKTKSKVLAIDADAPIQKKQIENLYARHGRIGNYYNAQQFLEANNKIPTIRVSIEYRSIVPGIYSWEAKQSTATTDNYWQQFSTQISDSFIREVKESSRKFVFRRLSAERNIMPEEEDEAVAIDVHGNGASNLIRCFLNHSDYDEKIIECELLNALNEIMYPDSVFQSIRIQQIEEGDKLLWEVFLQEKGCERFALSQSGSGLKTIILLLLNLLAVPESKNYKDKTIVYGFEELENNLHPDLQRKTFEYIYNFALKKDIYVFLTTHSHVVINVFSNKEATALYHVTKADNISRIKKIDNFIDKIEILNDLDVKASDLLQSNGIIWVEGPSDRIYIKRWLDVLSAHTFREGEHYQFLYYGGRLLSHYSYSEEEVTDLINILTTNRNAAIVLDSDKTNRQTPLNNTKKRIISEFEKFNMFAWVTKGKEIENYISVAAINEAFDSEITDQCSPYENFPCYIERSFNSTITQKVPFAHKIKDYITDENSRTILDLDKQIKQLHSQIVGWNK